MFFIFRVIVALKNTLNYYIQYRDKNITNNGSILGEAMQRIIDNTAVCRRADWIKKIQRLDGEFISGAMWLEQQLNAEVQEFGSSVLIDHLRLCGEIPESYPHDSREEKLYSKYTDVLLSETFKSLGFNSSVLVERGDTAGIDVTAAKFSFVADAKSFRLSRTAKNQKDFKVQAMDRWKRGKPYAMLVCPVYQLPVRSSQIYHQATSQNVCIFTYSHLAILLALSMKKGQEQAESLMYEIFRAVKKMKPSKDAFGYWAVINRTMMDFSPLMEFFWSLEKTAVEESLKLAQQESVNFLVGEEEKIMNMTREQAVRELIEVNKFDKRTSVIKSMSDNKLLFIR